MIDIQLIKPIHRSIIILAIGFLLVGFTSCNQTHGELHLISANENKGFNFPYFLFIPEEGLDTTQITIIIEPNNTGFPSDNFDDHMNAAKQQASGSQIGNFLSHKLNYPLVVPVFPRPLANWKIYTHALDRDALLQEGNAIERLDKQLIAIFNDAKMKFTQMGYEVGDTFIMTGFSACASFANRFAIIHPHKVKAYVAGGLNGMLVLPVRQVAGISLPYPIGVSDLYDLTGQQFDLASFQNIPQFGLMVIL